MGVLDTHYTVTPGGVYIAYQILGNGPIDVVWQPDWPGNIDIEQESPLLQVWFDELASFSRLILHDRRGIGFSGVMGFACACFSIGPMVSRTSCADKLATMRKAPRKPQSRVHRENMPPPSVFTTPDWRKCSHKSRPQGPGLWPQRGSGIGDRGSGL